MMDFFEHQDRARRVTAWLVVCYALSVAGIVGGVYLLVTWLWRMMATESETAARRTVEIGWWQPEILFWTAVGVLAVVLTGTLVRLAQLSRGGASVARELGGRPLNPATTDPGERRLLNVVEEMALAAGISMPRVFLLDREPGINAFAAGSGSGDAVIGVTRGAVDTLSRDELQGVVAHEFSHIVNGDMRLNLRLMGVLFGILALTVLGRILLRTAYFSGGGGRSRSRKGGNPLPLLGLGLIVIGYIGVFFANLIKSAVSRQREFLSDASAVQFTRDPAGLARALSRIAGRGSRLRTPRADEASHLFFSDALTRHLGGVFATHPPLEVRIGRLTGQRIAPEGTEERPAPASAGGPPALGLVSGQAGHIDIDAGQQKWARVPESLREAAHDRVAARALVYGLLLSEDSGVAARQREMLRRDAEALPGVESLARQLAGLDPGLRLPLVSLCIPALREMGRDEYERMRQVLNDLVTADKQIDLFEYALRHLVNRHLSARFERAGVPRVKYRQIESLLPACRTLLTAFVRWGGAEAAGEAAYREALTGLGDASTPPPASSVSLDEVDQALGTLAQAAPLLKRRILEACTLCVLRDRRVHPREYDLLRAVADALDVPMPPLSTEEGYP